MEIIRESIRALEEISVLGIGWSISRWTGGGSNIGCQKLISIRTSAFGSVHHAWTEHVPPGKHSLIFTCAGRYHQRKFNIDGRAGNFVNDYWCTLDAPTIPDWRHDNSSLFARDTFDVWRFASNNWERYLYKNGTPTNTKYQFTHHSFRWFLD